MSPPPAPGDARGNTTRARLLGSGEDSAFDRLLETDPFARAIVPRWEELAGWTESRLGAFRDGALVGGLSLALRRIPGLPFSLGRITCALLGSTRQAETLEALLLEVERVSRRRLVVETEIRLRIPQDGMLDDIPIGSTIERVLFGLEYRPLSKTETTYVVRIDRPDDALLDSFESMTRRRIKKVSREGLEVSTSEDPALIQLLYQSYLEMRERKGAPIPARALLVDGLSPLMAKGHATLFTESYGGTISSIIVADMLGLPCYILGARTPANVRGEVPGAAQALHFAIMRRLRDAGKKYYDLGGCEGPVPIPGHPNFGVWSFKHRFRGDFVRFIPYYRKCRGPTRLVLDAVHRYRGDYL